MSQLTTHILDTTIGQPARAVEVELFQQAGDEWISLSKRITNSDGRIPDLLADDIVLAPGNYKLYFNTGHYFQSAGIKAFYPFVEIVFEISSQAHYHVPLLLNPFGYSTYRGS